MDNLEEVLLELNRFEKKPPAEISPVMEEYLHLVAQTGNTHFPWPKIKPLFRLKLEAVIKEFHATFPTDELPPVPNVDPFSFSHCREKVFDQLDCFPGIPFTVQRLCELLTQPKKHYKRTDKFMRALEKNMLVVSTVDPRHKPPEDEDRNASNTFVNGDHGSESGQSHASPLRANGNAKTPEKFPTSPGPLFPSLPAESAKPAEDASPMTDDDPPSGDSSSAVASLSSSLVLSEAPLAFTPLNPADDAEQAKDAPEAAEAAVTASKSSELPTERASSTVELTSSTPVLPPSRIPSEAGGDDTPPVASPSPDITDPTQSKDDPAEEEAKPSSSGSGEVKATTEDASQPMDQEATAQPSGIPESEEDQSLSASSHDISSDTSIDDVTNHLAPMEEEPPTTSSPSDSNRTGPSQPNIDEEAMDVQSAPADVESVEKTQDEEGGAKPVAEPFSSKHSIDQPPLNNPPTDQEVSSSYAAVAAKDPTPPQSKPSTIEADTLASKTADADDQHPVDSAALSPSSSS